MSHKLKHQQEKKNLVEDWACKILEYAQRGYKELHRDLLANGTAQSFCEWQQLEQLMTANGRLVNSVNGRGGSFEIRISGSLI